MRQAFSLWSKTHWTSVQWGLLSLPKGLPERCWRMWSGELELTLRITV